MSPLSKISSQNRAKILLEGLGPAAKRRAEIELSIQFKNVTARSILREKFLRVDKARTYENRSG